MLLLISKQLLILKMILCMHIIIRKLFPETSTLFAEAIECYKKAIKYKSDYIDAINNLGHLQLLLGIYEDGWQNYEARKIDKKITLKMIKLLEWKGKQKLENKKNFYI